jgi:3-hydroxyisobutyrate dehydrogenase
MKVGLIGLGIMGQAMAFKLLEAEHELTIWNRTPEKAKQSMKLGAHMAQSPAELAASSDVVLSIVTDPAAVESITLGNDGIMEGLSPSGIHCDMSTVTPASAEAMAALYRQNGKRFVQAPVLGSRKQIEDGVLLVFGGGDREDLETCEGAWKAFSHRIWHLDTASQASAAKLACNMMIANMILGLGQSMLFAKKNDVDPSVFLEIICASALGCSMYESKGNNLLTRNFQAHFVVDNMLKDLTLAEDAAKSCKAPLPFNGLNREFFIAASNLGFGSEDYSAVVKVLETLYGMDTGL